MTGVPPPESIAFWAVAPFVAFRDDINYVPWREKLIWGNLGKWIIDGHALRKASDLDNSIPIEENVCWIKRAMDDIVRIDETHRENNAGDHHHS